MNKAPRQRPRKCACGCGNRFTPVRPMQTAATMECALRIALQKREKAERKAHREAKQAAKPLSWYIKKAQAAVNAYVRERDRYQPCISCGRWHQGQWHAGHYRPAGNNPALRFDPLNINRQCAPCNNHKSGNLSEYRINLIRKIGVEKVEWLEGPHPAKHWTREELLTIDAEFKAKLKQLRESQREAA